MLKQITFKQIECSGMKDHVLITSSFFLFFGSFNYFKTKTKTKQKQKTKNKKQKKKTKQKTKNKKKPKTKTKN